MSVDEIVTHRRTDVGRVALHVAEAGPPDGDRVVLLHGFPEFWYGWRHQIPVLAEAGYRVVAPDLRGYAGSDRPPAVRDYALDAVAGDVAGLVDAVGGQGATVVGHDWGGILAWVAAARYPEAVRRLVVLNAPHPAVARRALRDPLQALRFGYAAAFQVPGLPERLLSARRGALVRALLRGASTRPGAFSEADLARYGAAFSSPDALRGPLAYYRAAARGPAPSTPSARGTVRAPVTVLWGTRDPVLPLGLADPGRAVAPHVRVVPIAGAGHFVQADAPERVNAELLATLRGP